ncbi:MAG: glycosyltransferase family 2 protein [Elusimicrobia bacterium]|nr:glycosyltransferase family 2 protein [Elusimicrobiota bacterium]
MPLTSILIPCWNALELTRVSLARLLRDTTRPYELILVDNGSRDGTASWLGRWARSARRRLKGPRRILILSNAANRGYAAAMNQALGRARGECLLFGNADAAPTPGWLEAMQEALARGGRVGGVSPCANTPAARDRGWSAPPWYDDLPGLDRFAAAAALAPRARAFIPAPGFVPGFWFLTSRRVLDRVGVFDERFFPGGFEDWDLQWRMRRDGYAVGFAGRAYVHHVWFGCAARNGLSEKRLYGKTRLARFLALRPDAAGLPFHILVPGEQPAARPAARP